MGKPVVAIIGGSGFIGYSIASHMASTGRYEVRIADIRPPREIARHISYVECDIREPGDVEEAIKGADVVVNTAIIQIPAINEQKELAYEVNILGTINLCEAVHHEPSVKGLILAGTWHVFGDVGLKGLVDEGFGFRPDKVEPQARLYALHKVGQEVIVRIFDEMSDKIFGVIRQGTTIGEGMPRKTAANIFIEQALSGGPITPFRHSLHRPMLFTYIGDVCRAYEMYVRKILSGDIPKVGNSLERVVNVCYPEPITVLELAHMVKDIVEELTGGEIRPEIKVVNKNLPELFSPEDKDRIRVDVEKAMKLLELGSLTSPRKALEEVIAGRVKALGF